MIKTRIIYWSTVGYGLLPLQQAQRFYVLGHPKSGTSWTFRLVSDYLELPRLKPSKRRWPCLGPCVIKAHRFLPVDLVRDKTLYVVRDGRDVAISHYMSLVRGKPANRASIERHVGEELSAERLRSHLPQFLAYCQYKMHAAIPYRDHVLRALENEYCIIRYEDLLANGEETFGKAIETLMGKPADYERIRDVLQRNDFQTMTGRERGEEAQGVFMRKGVAGDWRNYFDRESAEIFDAHAGDLLVTLGYEPNRQWVNSIPA